MKSYSLTYMGVIVGILSWLFNFAGQPVIEADLQTFVNVAIGLGSALMILCGRYRKGDLSIWGFRK